MVGPLTPRLHVLPDPESVARTGSDTLLGFLGQAVGARGRASLALSGGSTPIPLYRRLAPALVQGPLRAELHLFWADERFVPPTSELSNYRTARESLFPGDPLPRGNVHPIPTTEAPTPEASAERYEAELRRVFADGDATFDVALLGVGPDGHTASLFPKAPALLEKDHWVRAVPLAPQPPHVPRVTLTLPALSLTRRVVVLATGEEKRSAVAAAFDPDLSDADRPPAGRVHGRESTEWFVDRAAAAGLPGPARA